MYSMGFLQRLYDRFIIAPTANRIVEGLKQEQKKVEKAEKPASMVLPYSLTYSDPQHDRYLFGSETSFQTLRNISTLHTTTRGAINLRKRQITQLDWSIVDESPSFGANYTEDQLYNIKDSFKKIAGPGIKFRTMLAKMVEDLLVFDALVYEKQRTRAGQVIRLRPIDASTIRIIVDQYGDIPYPPDKAYEQYIRGEKTAELTANDITYDMMNPRNNTPYGLSPIEAMLVVVDSSLRALMANNEYLSSNNVPMGFLGMPEGWSVQQIKEYKTYFDALVSGPKDQAKIFPIPSGTSYQEAKKLTEFSFKEFFDYLDRITCYMFDITPQDLGLEVKQYKVDGEKQDELSLRKGLKPLAMLLEDNFTDVLQNDWNLPGAVFRFNGLDHRFTLEEAKEMLPKGAIGVDEWRRDKGLPAIGVGNIVIGAQSVLDVTKINEEQDKKAEEKSKEKEKQEKEVVEGEDEEKEEPKEALEKRDLEAWRKKALNDIKKKGKVYRAFESNMISKNTKEMLTERLSKCESIDEVNIVFQDLQKGFNDNYDALQEYEKTRKYKEFKSKLKKALKKQFEPFTQPEVIESVTGFAKAEAVEVGVTEYFIALALDAYDFLIDAAKAGGNNAYEELGISGSFKPSDLVKQYIEDRSTFLINSVDQTTKDYIIRQIVEGKNQSMTNEEIAKVISDNVNQISEYRANLIVTTEVANAMQQAELETYKEQGIKKKVWRTSRDDLVCPFCRSLDGKVMSIEKSYVKKGDKMSATTYDEKGEEQTVYLSSAIQDVKAAPLHPGCRCYIQAVIE